MRVAATIVLMAVTGILVTGCTPEADTSTAPNPNQVIVGQEPATIAATEIELPDLETDELRGEPFSFAAYKGQVLMVNFWATWCGPCIRETPDLVALHDELGSRGFSVVGVSTDFGGLDVIEPFADRYGITYPMIMDDGSVSEAFGGVYSMPTTFLVNRSGVIVDRIVGMVPFEQIRPKLEEMLGS